MGFRFRRSFSTTASSPLNHGKPSVSAFAGRRGVWSTLGRRAKQTTANVSAARVTERTPIRLGRSMPGSVLAVRVLDGLLFAALALSA